MPRVVTEPCVGCKHGDCVEVCPVDCFFELDNMLVIDPDECTDCGACESECPKNISITHIARLNREFLIANVKD